MVIQSSFSIFIDLTTAATARVFPLNTVQQRSAVSACDKRLYAGVPVPGVEVCFCPGIRVHRAIR